MKILNQIREKYKSQKEMADSLGFAQATVCEWLTGKKLVSPNSINVIATKEGINPGEFFMDTYPADKIKNKSQNK